MSLKTVTFFFCLLLFSSFVFGDLNVVVPNNDIVSIGDSFLFNVQAFNGSGVSLDSSEYSCLLNLYGVNGIKELEVDMSNNGFDKEYLLNNSFHSDIGLHNYIVYCNSTTEYGFVSKDLFFSTGGLDVNNSNNSFTGIFLLLGLGLISFISLYAGSSIKDKKLENVKIFLWGLGVFHIVFISAFMMAQSFFNTDIGNILRYNEVLITYFVVLSLSLLYVIYSFVIFRSSDEVMDNYSRGGR